MLKKKMISVLLVLAMVLGMSVPAMAVSGQTVPVSAEEEAAFRMYEELRWNMEHLTGEPAQPSHVGDDLQTTTALAEAKSGPSVFSSRSTQTVVLKGTPVFSSSVDVGGYYYAYSPMSTSYSSLYVNVKFPTSLYCGNHTRVAFLSLGITGSLGGVDIGLKNAGDGWFPYQYDTVAPEGSRQVDYENNMAPANAAGAGITLKAVSDTQIRMGVQYQDASGNNVGEFFYITANITPGNLTYVNGAIRCRFYRFASLIPDNHVTTTNTDGTYMKNAKMLYCQLYDGSQYVTWGIQSARVNSAWLVSPEHITLTDVSDRNETVSIVHS